MNKAILWAKVDALRKGTGKEYGLLGADFPFLDCAIKFLSKLTDQQLCICPPERSSPPPPNPTPANQQLFHHTPQGWKRTSWEKIPNYHRAKPNFIFPPDSLTSNVLLSCLCTWISWSYVRLSSPL